MQALEIFPSSGLASAVPTMWYSSTKPSSKNFNVTLEPRATTSLPLAAIIVAFSNKFRRILILASISACFLLAAS